MKGDFQPVHLRSGRRRHPDGAVLRHNRRLRSCGAAGAPGRLRATEPGRGRGRPRGVTRPRHLLVVPVVLSVLGLSLAGCGALASPPALEGREFLSTGLTQGGADRPLVAGTRIRLSFLGGQLGASAGCNLMGGEYRLDGGRLVVTAVAMTEMGCDDPRHAQDDWLIGFLGARPTVGLAGNELTLQAGDTVIRLLDREVAEPDLGLVGPTWTVDSIVTGAAASSVPAGVVATLRFGADGRFEVDTGCNRGGGRAVGDEATLRFIEMILTERACQGPPGDLEAAVLAVLTRDAVTYQIDAQTLTLSAGDRGLILRGG